MSQKVWVRFKGAVALLDRKSCVLGLMMLGACASPHASRQPEARSPFAPPDIQLTQTETATIFKTINQMNADHDKPPSIRFAPLSGMSPKTLLFTNAMGSGTHYLPSTALAGLHSLRNNIATSPALYSQLIELQARYYPNKASDLVAHATRYGQFGKIVSPLSASAVQGLVRSYVSANNYEVLNINRNHYNWWKFSDLLDTAQQIGEDASGETKTAFVQSMVAIHDDTQAQGKPHAEAIGMALAALYEQDQTLPRTGRGYELSTRFPVPSVPPLETRRLFQNGLHVSTVAFYADEDGIVFYNGFLRQLSQSAAWRVTDEGVFNKAQSTRAPQGRAIMILIAKPSRDAENFKAIRNYMAERGLEQNSHMERGHIYNLQTENLIPGDHPVVVFWGGCNSTAESKAILGMAPEAYVVATQDMGRGVVNNAFYFAFLNNIQQSSLVPFQEILHTVTRQGVNPKGYMMPDANNAARLLHGIRSTATRQPY